MDTQHIKGVGVVGFWQGLSISSKILVGFSCILAILVAVTATGITNFMRAGDGVKVFAETVEDASAVSTIERDFLKMRLHVSNYLEHDIAAEGEKAKMYATSILAQITEARTNMQKHGQATDGLDVIEKDIGIFLKDFERAEYLSKDFRKLMEEKLVPDGDLLESNLKQVVEDLQATEGENITTRAALAMNHAVRARFYTSIALGREDADMVNMAKAELNKLEGEIASLSQEVQSDKDRALLQSMVALIAEYRGLTDKILAEKAEIHSLVDGEMKEMAQELTSEAEHMLDDAVLREKKIKEETDSIILAAEVQMIVIGVGGIIVGVLLSLTIGRVLSSPIKRMTNAMNKLSEGDLSVEICGQHRGDEIGQMARAVEIFKACGIEKEQMEAEQAQMAQRAEADKKAMMQDMAENFDSAIGGIITRVSGASTEMNATASQMSSTASETSQQSSLVSSAALEASANVQTVAAATEELSSSITEINKQVTQASTIAHRASETADSTIETVSELQEAAAAVGEVIALITEIADQTNMLAMNATIEAARAGNAGKGFAVVATEVKSLAEQTSKATGEISGRVASIQSKTEEAVQAMRGIGQTIKDVNEISAAISAAVEEQGAATHEIARNVQEAAQGTDLVTQNIQQVSQGATDTGAASAQVLQASDELSKQSESLRSEVQNFLRTIRAA